MNTADRSIALVDAAIRRRFAFVEMNPDEPPVRDVLAGFVGDQPGDQRVALLRALNAAIAEEDQDLRIGPSYLMKPEAASLPGLERIWKYDLLPLLDEHFYGRVSRQDIRTRFGLDALRLSLGAQTSETATAPEAGQTAGHITGP